jgi:rubredoxin-NAD+ reductase
MDVHQAAAGTTPLAPGEAEQPQALPGAPLVVVGTGLAGWTTVREFRKLDSVTPVIVVTANNGDFYAKPSLSNALAQKRTPEQLVSTPAAKMVETLNVKLLPHSTVNRIDTAAGLLTIESGGTSQTLAYSQLVLATGAQPIRSAIAGNASEQVLSVNSLEDFATFYAQLARTAQGPQASRVGDTTAPASNDPPAPKTVLVIGAGLIGCEFANDLLHAGYQVHVVDPSPRPLAALLPEAAGLQLQQALQDLGAQWHFGATVEAVNSSDLADLGDQRQSASAGTAAPLCASLADGKQIQVDVVLSAIGLRADTTLARAAGLLCERGIVVDSRLQTSAVQVYALGDGAQYASAGQRTLPFVMPIMNAAKALAATLAGNPTELVFPLMPVSIKTPALPIVVSAAHPALAGIWVADATEPAGVWRFVDTLGAQHGFVLTGKNTARRMELSKTTQH